MGQQVAAIVYGVEVPKYGTLRDEDGDWLPGKPDIAIETGENDYHCIGIAVAVQNVAENEEVELPEGPLCDLSSMLYKPLLKANKRWQKIAAWALTHNVNLGSPTLLLVTIERA